MCRSTAEGYRRCRNGKHGKVIESYQKALYYRAKKSGKTIDQWIIDNPDSVKKLQDKRDSSLESIQSLESLENSTLIPDADGTFSYKLITERRVYDGVLDLEEYKEEKEDYCRNLKLTERQESAIRYYSNDLFNPLNKYFLEKPEEDIFNEDSLPWEETEDGYQTFFNDESDLMDYASELDISLSHRSKEKRNLYRGMSVHMNSSLFVDDNGQKFPIKNLDDQKEFLDNLYTPGTEIAFNAYSSASDYVGVGAEWCGIDEERSKHNESISILYEMKTNAGLPIAHISDNEHEREVLLPRGIRYKVSESYWNDDNQYTYDVLEETIDNSSTYISEGKSKNQRVLIVQLVEVNEYGEEVNTNEPYEAPALVPRAFR